jgi:hypothetical protein
VLDFSRETESTFPTETRPRRPRRRSGTPSETAEEITNEPKRRRVSKKAKAAADAAANDADLERDAIANLSHRKRLDSQYAKSQEELMRTHQKLLESLDKERDSRLAAKDAKARETVANKALKDKSTKEKVDADDARRREDALIEERSELEDITSARIARAESAQLASLTNSGANLAAQLNMQKSIHDAHIEIASLKATAAASEESKRHEVEAASAKAKNAMYEKAMTSKVEDATMLASQQQERDKTRERHELRLREDQRLRDQDASCRGRTAAFLELAKLSKSSSDPFSPTATAQGLMQMESAQEAPTRVTAQAPNEPQPSAPLLCAAQATLTIEAAPPPLTPAQEMAKLTAKLERLNMMLCGFATRYASRCANLSTAGGTVDKEADEELACLLTNRSILEKKIEALNSRMYELTQIMFAEEMDED